MSDHKCPGCDEAACICVEVHDLKVWPDYYEELAEGRKTHEIRRNDRDFQVGCLLRQRKFIPCETCGGSGINSELVDVRSDHEDNPCISCDGAKGTYCPDSPALYYKVPYITPGGKWGIDPDFVVMSIIRIKPGSPLIEHAERELRISGFTHDSEKPGPEIRKGVLDIVRIFALQDHSGMTDALTISILDKLLKREPLSPLTGADHEWEDVSHMSGDPSVQWQNRRCGRVLKGPDGIAFDVMRRVFVLPDGQQIRDAARGAEPIEFPYLPETEVVEINSPEEIDSYHPSEGGQG